MSKVTNNKLPNGIFSINVVDYLDTVKPLIEAKVGKEMHDAFYYELFNNDNHIACGVILRPSWDYVYSIINNVNDSHKRQLQWINDNVKGGKRYEEMKKDFLEALDENCLKREKLKACLPAIKAVIDEFEKQDVYYKFFW